MNEKRARTVLLTLTVSLLIISSISSLGTGTGPPINPLSSDPDDDVLDVHPPHISWTSPANGQMDLYPNAEIVIQFNESMNASSFSYEFLSGTDPGMTWNWESTAYDNDTVRGTHTPLFCSPCEYIFNVTHAEDLAGNALVPGPVPNPWNWSVIVVIIETVPVDGETNVSLSQNIEIFFSGPVDIMTLPVLFWIITPDPGIWTVIWTAGDTAVVLSPAVPFEPCTLHTVYLHIDFSPFPSLVPNPWSFTTICINPTVLSTYPPNGAVGIPVDAPLIVNFSEPMDTSTISMTVDPDPGGWMPMEWNVDDSTLWWNHTNSFMEEIGVTVWIMTGKDKTGVDLVPLPYGWSFLPVSPTMDLRVDPSHIFFDPPDPVDNGTLVTIFGTVFNDGFGPVIDVLVRFYDGAIQPSNQINDDSYIPFITFLGSQDASVQWNASPPGSHDICVFADPLNSIPEFNESNNQACTPIEVLPPNPIRPPTVTNASLTGGSHEDVLVHWELSPDEVNGSVAGYDVYRGSEFSTEGSGYALHDSLPSGTSSHLDVGGGEGDPLNHFYIVCALDTIGNSFCSPYQAAKFTRPLAQGPNLVSIPLIRSGYSPETVLQTVKYDMAWFYESFSHEWKWYMKDKTYSGGLSNLNRTMGLWVNVTQECNLTVAGIVPAETTIELRTGWNLVSFPSFNASHAVADLKAETGATRVEGYYPSPPYHLRVLGDGEMLQAGMGYWVKVEADITWIVEVS